VVSLIVLYLVNLLKSFAFARTAILCMSDGNGGKALACQLYIAIYMIIIIITVIIIIIIINILGISVMRSIYTYVPETNHIRREHCVAAILVLLFMVLISLVPALTPLYLYVSTFRNVCGAQYGCFL